MAQFPTVARTMVSVARQAQLHAARVGEATLLDGQHARKDDLADLSDASLALHSAVQTVDCAIANLRSARREVGV